MAGEGPGTGTGRVESQLTTRSFVQGRRMDLWALVLGLTAVWAAVLSRLDWAGMGRELLPVAVLSATALLCETFPARTPFTGGGTISVGGVLITATVLLLGPAAAAVVGFVATVRIVDDLVRRTSSLRVFLLNRVALSLGGALAGVVFVALGGVPGRVSLGIDLVAIVVASAIQFLTNALAAVGYSALRIGKRMSAVWAWDFSFANLSFLAYPVIGTLFALLWVGVGPLAVLVLLVPLGLSHLGNVKGVIRHEKLTRSAAAMMARVGTRDNFTPEHSQRVADMALELAGAMGLSPQEQELAFYAGYLHDIGKVEVDESIIMKPAGLDASEYAEVQRHVAVGEQMVRGLPLFQTGAPWILHHHERYDGQGYPNKLGGEMIPIGSRILAVVDAYDAMVNDRPYRKGMSPDRAFEQLRQGAARQFDPEVVAAFLRLKHVDVEPDFVDKARQRAAQDRGRLLARALPAFKGLFTLLK